MRYTLAGLLVVPLVSLVALWAFGASLTLGNAIQERHYNQVVSTIAGPSTLLSNRLSQERLQTFTYLTGGHRTSESSLFDTRALTDLAIASYRRAALASQGLENGEEIRAQNTLLAALSDISAIRATVDDDIASPAGAFQAYNGIIDDEFAVYTASSQVDSVPVYEQTTGSIDAEQTVEQVDREVALVGGAAAVHGRMSTGDRELFIDAVANQRLLIGNALSLFNPQLRALWAPLFNSPTYHQFNALQDSIIASVGSKAAIPVNLAAWQSVSGKFLGQLEHAESQEAAPLATLAGQLGNRLLLEAILAGGLGLVAVVASILLMLRFGRRLIGELGGLHDSARSIAEDRLPSVVERLRRGDDVDVAGEAPPPPTGEITEIVKVAEAFSTVQRTAVEAAVGQANLRRGVSHVFLNLSLRNQSLLHRQLALLDTMERATSEPAALADLFRLDHLTTRMRRHAEGLIILSGATPSRGWRDPVPAIDVLRAAIAEVEDYVRVDVMSESRDYVAGPAVNDVIHLIAELVENATAFSPPNTQVEVKADSVAAGFAVEIEDRGLGLSNEEMAEINERLTTPPEFDLANSDQLGLFVVGQLADRHGIKVSLRESPYGGTRAIILMPRGIIVRDGETADYPGQSDDDMPPVFASATSPAGAHADAGLNRERSSMLSMTGRHRLPQEPLDDQIPAPASEVTRAQTPSQGWSPGIPWQEAPWPDTLRQEPWHEAWQRVPRQREPQAVPLPAPRLEAAPPPAPRLEIAPPPPPRQEIALPSPRHEAAPASRQEAPAQEAPLPDMQRQEVQRLQALRQEAPSRALPPATTPAGGPASDGRGPRPAPGGPASNGTHLGMPRRVRQASLAPQLRTGRPASPGGSLPPKADPATRSPEQARSLMAALQTGWEQGRTDDLDESGGWPGDDPGPKTATSDGEAT
jgi:signal transduction histidine kinase